MSRSRIATMPSTSRLNARCRPSWDPAHEERRIDDLNSISNARSYSRSVSYQRPLAVTHPHRHGRARPGHQRLLMWNGFEDVDARNKCGHDESEIVAVGISRS